MFHYYNLDICVYMDVMTIMLSNMSIFPPVPPCWELVFDRFILEIIVYLIVLVMQEHDVAK